MINSRDFSACAVYSSTSGQAWPWAVQLIYYDGSLTWILFLLQFYRGHNWDTEHYAIWPRLHSREYWRICTMPIILQYIRHLFTNFSTNYHSLSIPYMPVPMDFSSWYTGNAITIRMPEEYYVLIKQNHWIRLKMKLNDTKI